MKTIKTVKIVGMTAVILLFTTIVFSGFFFEATHKVTQEFLSPTDIDILQVETIIVTALCTAYTLLMFPWLLYFMKIEKKSGLQYFSLYPMTGGKTAKVTAIALTLLNAVTAIGFYIMYMMYTQGATVQATTDSQSRILTLLCLAIIFWGGTYLAYGSVYGAKRMKNIIKKKREKRQARRELSNN